MKECPRCLFDESIASIGEHQCEYCDLHDELELQANPHELKRALASYLKDHAEEDGDEEEFDDNDGDDEDY